MITIKGYVRSVDVEKLVAPLADSPEADWYDGARSVMAITYIEMCSYEKKLTSGSIAITPVELSSDVFGAGCSEEAFKYEGMLVTITDAQVQECACTMISDLVTVTVNADRFTLIFLTQGSGGGYNSFGRFRSLLDRSRFIQVKEHLTDFLIDLQDWHANSQVAFFVLLRTCSVNFPDFQKCR